MVAVFLAYYSARNLWNLRKPLQGFVEVWTVMKRRPGVSWGSSDAVDISIAPNHIGKVLRRSFPARPILRCRLLGEKQS